MCSRANSSRLMEGKNKYQRYNETLMTTFTNLFLKLPLYFSPYIAGKDLPSISAWHWQKNNNDKFSIFKHTVGREWSLAIDGD